MTYDVYSRTKSLGCSVSVILQEIIQSLSSGKCADARGKLSLLMRSDQLFSRTLLLNMRCREPTPARLSSAEDADSLPLLKSISRVASAAGSCSSQGQQGNTRRMSVPIAAITAKQSGTKDAVVRAEGKGGEDISPGGGGIGDTKESLQTCTQDSLRMERTLKEGGWESNTSIWL